MVSDRWCPYCICTGYPVAVICMWMWMCRARRMPKFIMRIMSGQGHGHPAQRRGRWDELQSWLGRLMRWAAVVVTNTTQSHNQPSICAGITHYTHPLTLDSLHCMAHALRHTHAAGMTDAGTQTWSCQGHPAVLSSSEGLVPGAPGMAQRSNRR